MEKYLPSIISLVGVVLTIGVSLWLGLAKQRTDNKTAGDSAEVSLRDDLIQMQTEKNKQLELKDKQILERDERLEKRDQQLSAAQQIIFTQLEKITDLNITVRQLQSEVQELRTELEKFNRRVYYNPREDGERRHEP